MAYLVRYFSDSGQIDGVYQSDIPDLLAAQRVAEPGIAYLLTDEAIPLLDQERLEVREEAVVARTEVQFMASPSPFAADGVTECTLRLEPFVPCTLDINGQQLVLTAEDPEVILTADSPQVLTVRLLPTPGYWAAPLTVEARTDA
jgi:hypothetical protein